MIALQRDAQLITPPWHEFNAKVEQLAEENGLGAPLLVAPSLRTSHNSIHHLYHLFRFEQFSKQRINNIGTIVEWGGGYGNMAKIIWRHGNQPTYVMIDSPIMCCLQWLYLSVTLPKTPTHLITSSNDRIREHAINILPVGLSASYRLQSEVFLSTWAVSESGVAAQQDVANRKWFGARHLLIGFQESDQNFPDAGNIAALAIADGATIEDIPALAKSHYALR